MEAGAQGMKVKLGSAGKFKVMNNTETEEQLAVEEQTGKVTMMKPSKATGFPRKGGLKSGTKTVLHDTGTDNTFVGPDSGDAQDSDLLPGEGVSNTGIGSESLKSNRQGSRNFAGGHKAMRANTSGQRNAAVGPGALEANTTGSFNSAMGDLSLSSNISGARNTAIGQMALNANQVGDDNTAVGFEALEANTASANTAVGASALSANTTGDKNAAFGFGALTANTESENSAFGYGSLGANTTGIWNAAFGASALEANTTAGGNSAFGALALTANTTAQRNSAFGSRSLMNSTGTDNSAFGFDSLVSNTTGGINAAFGSNTMDANTTGQGNAAFGERALELNTTGAWNTAIGRSALNQSVSGSDNIAVGNAAGVNLTSGSDNIYIGHSGDASANGVIRIGSFGTHNAVYIAGTTTAIVGSNLGVSGSGQLGINVSSMRFKRDVEDMEDASSALMSLRPVTFKYREELGEGSELRQFGLIAEEVAEVEPGLVVYDEDGKPYAVRYQFLAPMLLNEVQQQQRTIGEQGAVIARYESADAEQDALIQEQRAMIDALVGRIERLESQRPLSWLEPPR
jgi:hypothetical protein